MKIFKKVIALMSVAASLLAFSSVVSAATNDDIINALKSANVKAEYIAIASDYLKSNTFTADQLDAALTNVNSAITVMKSENQTDVTQLSASAKTQLVNIVNNTSKQTGISVTIGKDTKGVSFIKLASASGTPYVISKNDLSLKVTGSDNYFSYIMLAIGLILITLSSAFIATRKLAHNVQ